MGFAFAVRPSVFSSTNRTQALDVFKLQAGRQEMELQLHVSAEETSDKKHGRSFKKSGGKGHIELKCRDRDPADVQLQLFVSIGIGQQLSHRSRLVEHNFATRPTVVIPSEQRVWTFLEAADAEKKNVTVCVEISKMF